MTGTARTRSIHNFYLHCGCSLFDKSNCSATARETSTIRFRDVGPRSLTVTSTLLPFFVFVIRTLVPHG
jgi:hypothetical protein